MGVKNKKIRWTGGKGGQPSLQEHQLLNYMEEYTMDKDLHYESNATLLSTLLNIPAEDLTCKNISDILTSPLSIKGIGNKKASKLYAVKEVVRRIMEEKPSGDPTPSREDIAVTERLVKSR